MRCRNREGRVAVIPQHGVVKRGTLASILRQAGLTLPSSSISSTEPAGRSAAIRCRLPGVHPGRWVLARRVAGGRQAGPGGWAGR